MADTEREVMLKWHADVANLRDMMRSPGWDTYLAYMEKLVKEEIEHVLGAGPSDEHNYKRGVVAGLRRAANLPAEVTKNTDSVRN